MDPSLENMKKAIEKVQGLKRDLKIRGMECP